MIIALRERAERERERFCKQWTKTWLYLILYWIVTNLNEMQVLLSVDIKFWSLFILDINPNQAHILTHASPLYVKLSNYMFIFLLYVYVQWTRKSCLLLIWVTIPISDFLKDKHPGLKSCGNPIMREGFLVTQLLFMNTHK